MADAAPEKHPERPRSAAGTVAAGIFASRIVGFVREAVVAFFLGVGAHTDVFQAAFRAPNLLQNLLGEGTISAAFIPVYSRMIQEGREEEAGRFARSEERRVGKEWRAWRSAGTLGYGVKATAE